VYLAADALSGEPKPIATAERYTVIVHADKEGTAWVETESGPAPLRRAVVERLLCDCTLRLAREEGDGSFVLSRRGRTVPAVTRRAIEVRDRGRCRVPGCTRRLWLEAHHLKLWSRGGKHRRGNLLLMCRQHHQLCHEGLLVVEQDDEGEFRFAAVGGWKLGEGEELEENWEPVVRDAQDDLEEGDTESAPAHDPEEWSLPSLPRGGGRRRRWGTLIGERRVPYLAGPNVSAETFRARPRACLPTALPATLRPWIPNPANSWIT
jgi:hypothetical protein